jgi:uncharacterized protein with FMN-binding domain
MRRAPIVITATVAGIGAVLGFHTQAATVPLAAATSKTTASSAASSSSATTTTTTKSSTASSASTTKTASTATKTALGDPMSTRYGPAQVRVTVSGGKIVKVEAVQLQNADSKSVAISSYAEPILRQSALAKQGAAVDAVSGATYTSLSYEGSLQSALDKLGVKAADGSVASTDMSQLQ